MKELTLKIDGMSCGSCVRHVEGALTSVSGVKSAKVNLKAGHAVVQIENVNEKSLLEAVSEAGYAASVLAEKSEA